MNNLPDWLYHKIQDLEKNHIKETRALDIWLYKHALEAFPEAQDILIRLNYEYQLEIKELKIALEEMAIWRLTLNIKEFSRHDLWGKVKEHGYNEKIKELTKKIRINNRYFPEKKVKGRITTRDIDNAREYPITNLVEINSGKKTQCIFHKDEKPSLHIYENTNSFYCFVCCEGGDVIKLYMKLENCDFISAVKKLK